MPITRIKGSGDNLAEVDATGKLATTATATIGGDVEVVQPTAADLKATVTQASSARTISGTATVTQAAKDRTVTGTVIATQSTQANLKATVYQASSARTISGTATVTQAGDVEVVQPTAADLKATVTQASATRDIEGGGNALVINADGSINIKF